MGEVKKRINYEDRLEIEKLYNKGYGHKKISEIIGIHEATMSREYKRRWDEMTCEYNADLSQRRRFDYGSNYCFTIHISKYNCFFSLAR